MSLTPDSSGVNGSLDAGAVTLYVASLANILPSIAAFLSIVWFLLRIVESRTVQSMLARYGWDWVVRGDKNDD